MDGKYILSIDGGTQSTKVLIFDLEGNVVCEGREGLRPMDSPQVGWAEHPDDDLWDSLVAACEKAFAAFSGDLQDIIGVGLCTIRCCRVYLRDDGSLAYPVIDWMDPRAYGPFAFPTDDTRYAAASTGYFTHRLTGEFKDTVANNIYWQHPTDAATWDWSADDKVFEAFNLKRDQVLELVLPGTILGYVTEKASGLTGIPAGLPVVATANDKAVEALGAGLMSEMAGLVSLGTYTTVMLNGGNLSVEKLGEILANPQSFWPNFGCIPYKFTLESASGVRKGMWMISWFRDLFGTGLELEAARKGLYPLQLLNEEAANVPAGSDGLMTVAEWQGPVDVPYKKGIYMGFDARHGRAHMFRSLLEGMVFMLFNRYRAMCDETGIEPQEVIASGGGSKGDTFVQIIADIFGLPVRRNVCEDAAGMGSAISVAVALGVYADYDSATRAMVRTARLFEPNMGNHRKYMEINDVVHSSITDATDPILEKAYPLFN